MSSVLSYDVASCRVVGVEGLLSGERAVSYLEVFPLAQRRAFWRLLGDVPTFREFSDCLAYPHEVLKRFRFCSRSDGAVVVVKRSSGASVGCVVRTQVVSGEARVVAPDVPDGEYPFGYSHLDGFLPARRLHAVAVFGPEPYAADIAKHIDKRVLAEYTGNNFTWSRTYYALRPRLGAAPAVTVTGASSQFTSRSASPALPAICPPSPVSDSGGAVVSRVGDQLAMDAPRALGTALSSLKTALVTEFGELSTPVSVCASPDQLQGCKSDDLVRFADLDGDLQIGGSACCNLGVGFLGCRPCGPCQVSRSLEVQVKSPDRPCTVALDIAAERRDSHLQHELLLRKRLFTVGDTATVARRVWLMNASPGGCKGQCDNVPKPGWVAYGERGESMISDILTFANVHECANVKGRFIVMSGDNWALELRPGESVAADGIDFGPLDLPGVVCGQGRTLLSYRGPRFKLACRYYSNDAFTRYLHCWFGYGKGSLTERVYHKAYFDCLYNPGPSTRQGGETLHRDYGGTVLPEHTLGAACSFHDSVESVVRLGGYGYLVRSGTAGVRCAGGSLTVHSNSTCFIYVPSQVGSSGGRLGSIFYDLKMVKPGSGAYFIEADDDYAIDDGGPSDDDFGWMVHSASSSSEDSASEAG